MRVITLVALVLSLCGCSQLEALFMSSPEKLNKAFPPNAEVRAAQLNLLELVQDTPSLRAGIEAQIATLQEVRGLTCSLGLAISRFDSVSQVRQLPVSRSCLNEHDAKALRFLQLKQVEFRLLQPPLRPLVALGPPQLISTDLTVVSAISAADAGVAVLNGARGEMVSVEIPGGTPITRLTDQLRSIPLNNLMSPNGRMISIAGRPSGDLTIYDTETGAPLWHDQTTKELLVWMPALSAAIATSNNGTALLADFSAAELITDVPGLPKPGWALPLADGQIAIGNERTIVLVTITRQDGALHTQTNKTLSLENDSRITTGRPTTMLEGRALVFTSNRNLVKVDLESGETTRWELDGIIANRFAKLSESELLVDSPSATGRSAQAILNIDQATLALVEAREGSSGMIPLLGERSGFMRRNAAGLWLGDTLSAGAPVDLLDYLSERNLERQTARLAALTRQGMTGSEQRIPQHPQQSPPLIGRAPYADIAADARIEGVGVYESSTPRSSGPGNRPGNVELLVSPANEPLVLVLSSYESVNWRLRGRLEQVKLILLSSYYPSSVEGAGSIPVRVIDGGHAYSQQGAGFRRLSNSVEAQTGKPLRFMQGSYKGAAFSVGGR